MAGFGPRVERARHSWSKAGICADAGHSDDVREQSRLLMAYGGRVLRETMEVLRIRPAGALVLVAVVIAGCGAAARGGAEGSSEAALRRHAVAVRTKPLWLDAMFEGEGGRSTVSWIGPIYPPAPREYPGTDGSGVAGYRYRYRIGDGSWTGWQKTKKPGFLLLHTHKGEKIDLYVQPIDDAGVPREPASAILTVAGPTLTPDNPGGSEPGEYGRAELEPEP